MTRHQRPSDDLQALAWQLRTALESLQDDADGPDARDFRRFLRRVVAHAWRSAATGKFTVVRDVIDLVLEARPMVDDAMPKLSPRAVAAVEVQQALATLYVGEDELRELDLENRLTDHGRHPTERAVLEVLAQAEHPLRQKEVFDRMPHEGRPTLARVGQVLRELFDHGFTRRQLARARGHAEAAHYQLAPRGSLLCQQLGVPRPEAKITIVAPRLMARATDKSQERLAASEISPVSIAALGRAWLDASRRRIVSGLFQSAQNPSVSRLCLEELSVASTLGAGWRKREVPVIKERELILERGRIAMTRDVFDDVQLVGA